MSNYKRYYNNHNSLVFITIVTKNRQNILIDYIQIFKISLKKSIEKFKYKIIACVILNDHCHLLIQAEETDKIPLIVRDIKYNFVQSLPQEFLSTIKLTESELKRNEKGIWQRRYYDHIIRNEEDFNRHLDYIHYNSIKHYQIPPKDWEYSSFEKFVHEGFYNNNWCNFNDINKISEMNLK